MATATWIGGASGNFNTASNWSTGSVPSWQDISIPAGSTVILTSNVSPTGSFYVTGTGTVTLSGAYTLAFSNGLYLNAGETVALSGTTLSSSSLNLTGTGTFTISGGKYSDSNGIAVATGQNLVLANTTYSTSSGATGAGIVTLSGTTATFTGSAPTAEIYFSTVSSGGTGNTMVVPDYSTSLNIKNLGYGDSIYASGGSGGDTLKLTANSDGTTYTLTDTTTNQVLSSAVTLASGTTASSFSMSNGYFVYTGSAACFYAGTMLATAEGEIAVEDITAGTLLKTASGEILPVRWVGRSEVSTRFTDPLKVLPIRIKAGALAEGVPARDLLLSPDHAVFLNGVLVQAGALVNGVTITREENVPELFTYYHVELATHELLLAEGAEAESFVDNIDRMNFHNWDERATHAPVEEMACPRAKAFRQVPEAVRQALALRAGINEAKAA
jgi:hypothetical protein